jgi:predicted phosphohydrolase
MKTAWITDPHLNFLTTSDIKEFAKSIRATDAELCLITGDIGESPSLHHILGVLDANIDMPIYFVLGNHDFWHSSMREVREGVTEITKSGTRLMYMGHGDVIQITPKTIIIGVDGWYDGLAGVGPNGGTLRLWDSTYIEDLKLPTEFQHAEKLKKLGKESADITEAMLIEANKYEQATDWLLLTHVPPFREASWHDGRIGSDMAAPLFVNKQLGERLMVLMEYEYPDKNLTVLCGHTHHKAEYSPLPNLTVKCGGATYNHPEIQEIIEL